MWRPWIERAASRWPDQSACEADGERVSYAALRDRSVVLAGRLRTLGVRPGDRVASLLTPGIAVVELLNAAQLGGWAVVPLHDRLAASEIAARIARIRPRVTLVDDAHQHLWTESGSPAHGLSLADLQDVAPDETADHVARVEDVLAAIFTSGTTGRAKLVGLTSANFEAGAVASAARLGCCPGDRWLAAMPMSHVGGLSIPVRCALSGMSLVVQHGFVAAEVDRALRDEKIAYVSLVPTMLQRVLTAGGDVPYPATLRAVVLGGGRLPMALVERARVAGVPLVATFGMTETAAQVTTSRPGDAYVHPGSAGQPLEGAEIRIAQPDAEGVGEILVRGRQVFGSYLEDAERTAAVLRDGWLHTGDLGRIDEDGRLWVSVRRTDLIVTGGENVSPEEVEEALEAHPEIVEAAVFGIEDDEWGQRVAVAVVVTSGASLTEASLHEWCRARLAPFQVPRQVFRVEALPRTVSGKLQRSRVAALLAAGGAS